jgi:hypothetical protein
MSGTTQLPTRWIKWEKVLVTELPGVGFWLYELLGE